MSKLFILGAGFSKAFSSKMPTINDIGKYIEENIDQLPGENKDIYRNILKNGDIESLLTYLYQSMPWKTDEENYIGKAGFIKVSNLITNYIMTLEKSSFQDEIPVWANSFVQFLHQNLLTVVSLNYDTVMERLSKELKSRENPEYEIDTSQLYSMPINHPVNEPKDIGEVNFIKHIDCLNCMAQ